MVQRIFLAQTRAFTARRAVRGHRPWHRLQRNLHGGGQDSGEQYTRDPFVWWKEIFRSPSLPGLFGTTNHYGLTDALIGEGPIRTFAKPSRWRQPVAALERITCSPIRQDFSTRSGLRSGLAELRTEFDYVLIDAPPLTRYADAIGLRPDDGWFRVGVCRRIPLVAKPL